THGARPMPAGRLLIAACSVVILASPCAAQRPEPDRSLVYKKTPTTDLQLNVYFPTGHQASDRRAAILFFPGGGWAACDPRQFSWHSRELAERGMVAITVDYRVRTRDRSTPIESVSDAWSA